MSRLTNLNSIHIGYTVNWTSTWYEQNNNYTYLLIKDIYIYEYLFGIFYKLSTATTFPNISENYENSFMIYLNAYFVRKRLNLNLLFFKYYDLYQFFLRRLTISFFIIDKQERAYFGRVRKKVVKDVLGRKIYNFTRSGEISSHLKIRSDRYYGRQSKTYLRRHFPYQMKLLNITKMNYFFNVNKNKNSPLKFDKFVKSVIKMLPRKNIITKSILELYILVRSLKSVLKNYNFKIRSKVKEKAFEIAQFMREKQLENVSHYSHRSLRWFRYVSRCKNRKFNLNKKIRILYVILCLLIENQKLYFKDAKSSHLQKKLQFFYNSNFSYFRRSYRKKYDINWGVIKTFRSVIKSNYMSRKYRRKRFKKYRSYKNRAEETPYVSILEKLSRTNNLIKRNNLFYLYIYNKMFNWIRYSILFSIFYISIFVRKIKYSLFSYNNYIIPILKYSYFKPYFFSIKNKFHYGSHYLRISRSYNKYVTICSLLKHLHLKIEKSLEMYLGFPLFLKCSYFHFRFPVITDSKLVSDYILLNLEQGRFTTSILKKVSRFHASEHFKYLMKKNSFTYRFYSMLRRSRKLISFYYNYYYKYKINLSISKKLSFISFYHTSKNLFYKLANNLHTKKYPLLGMRIEINGPVKKGTRTKMFIYRDFVKNYLLLGKMPNSTIVSDVTYWQDAARTKTASIGIKVWTFYNTRAYNSKGKALNKIDEK